MFFYYRHDDVPDTNFVNSDTVKFDDSTTKELVVAVANLKTISPDKFQSVIESFKNAHTRATDEFVKRNLSVIK